MYLHLKASQNAKLKLFIIQQLNYVDWVSCKVGIFILSKDLLINMKIVMLNIVVTPNHPAIITIQHTLCGSEWHKVILVNNFSSEN